MDSGTFHEVARYTRVHIINRFQGFKKTISVLTFISIGNGSLSWNKIKL